MFLARVAVLVVPPWIAALLFWIAFVACVETPIPDDPPIARVIVSWDPLACGSPHRVAVELEDEAGIEISGSTPCTQGSLSLDAPHFGIYRGRIYAWVAGEAIRSVTTVRIAVDEAVVRWIVMTPP